MSQRESPNEDAELKKKICVEICAASVDDVLIAQQAGADRVELNSALSLGGLTPSFGCLQTVLRESSLPVIAMSRPRPSGFCYSDLEFQTLMRDAEIMLQTGAQGIAFGVLNERRQVDAQRCQRMVQLIGTADAVFHRAFDLTANWQREIEVLIDCGLRRLMTSGQRSTAQAGSSVIAEIIQLAGGRIEILPAGGIKPDHVCELIQATGCGQIHAGLGQFLSDPSQPTGGDVDFYSAMPDDPANYRQTCGDTVRQLVSRVHSWR